MNREFNIFKLSDVAKIIVGGDKPKIFSTSKSSSNKIPIFANAEKKYGLYGYTDTARITEPAVTIAARGSNVGFVALRKKPYFPIVRLLSLVPKRTQLDVNYLYYYLKLNRQSGMGSGQPQITIPNISSRSISLPSLHIQQKVSEVLSSLDNKIELNNKINVELEEMAKLIYDYWFVQFDFPDENGKPYKSSGGKMVYNEKLNREVPDDWVACAISEWFTSEKSGDWGKESAQDNYTLEVACIRGADIGGLNGEGEEKAPIRYIHKNNKDKILSNFDMVIEISGGSPTQSTGRIAAITPELINRFRHPLICSNFCKVISMKDSNYFYNFFYQWKSFYKSGLFFKWEGKTSGIKNLLFENFIDIYKTTKPPKEIARNFNKLILPLEVKRQTLLDEITELKSLRDWLLPMLINGQVIVSEERMKSLSKSNN